MFAEVSLRNQNLKLVGKKTIQTAEHCLPFTTKSSESLPKSRLECPDVATKGRQVAMSGIHLTMTDLSLNKLMNLFKQRENNEQSKQHIWYLVSIARQYRAPQRHDEAISIHRIMGLLNEVLRPCNVILGLKHCLTQESTCLIFVVDSLIQCFEVLKYADGGIEYVRPLNQNTCMCKSNPFSHFLRVSV